MPVGVDGLAADHADRTPCPDHLPRALGEGAGRADRHAHQQHLGRLGVVVERRDVVLERGVVVGLGQRVGLDDHLRRRRIPAQAHRAGTELLLDGFELLVVHEFDGRARGDAEGVAVEGAELVEDLVDLLGEQGRLLLLQRDAHELGARADLQIERTRSRDADGADDNPVRPGELVNSCRHRSILGS